MNKVYYGPNGSMEYCQRLLEFDWDDPTLSVVGVDANSVLVKFSARKAKNKATGRVAEIRTYQEVRSIFSYSFYAFEMVLAFIA